MLTEPTVFVIGAGAHVPYGYPTGAQLKEDILRLTVDELPWNRRHEGYRPQVQHELDNFKREFSNSADFSIDAFLETRTDLLTFGKYCIASRIISYEKPSRVSEYKRDKGVGKDWIGWLMHEFLKPPSLDQFGTNAVSFITFNYDRQLEHTLFQSLKAQFNAGDTAVRDAIESMPIIHVHGTIGRLPWQTKRTDDDFVLGMEGDLDQHNILGAADCIKLVHESQEQNEEIAKANKLLADAKMILFLGFGYHEQNLCKLSFPFGDKSRWIDGSAFGLTEAERINLRNQLFRRETNQDLFPGRAEWDCLMFLRNCGRLLAHKKLLGKR